MCSFEQPPPPSLSTWFVYTCSHIILRFCAVVWKNFKVVGILTGFWKKRLKKGPKKYKCHNSSPFRNRYNSWGLIWCYIVKYVIFCKTLKSILNSILQHFTLFFYRVLLYQAVEDLLFKFGLEGKACLLRAICEMHESPLIGYGFFGEVLELFLTYVPYLNYFMFTGYLISLLYILIGWHDNNNVI